MPTAIVRNYTGAESGSTELDSRIFAGTINKFLVQETIRWQLAKRRAGTASAKERSQKEGGKKKPFKQKGSGRARAGSSISPLWVGGASIMGPRPRSYDYRLPKRTRHDALVSVLSLRASENAIIVVDDAKATGKTKDFVTFLEGAGLTGKRLAIVTDGVSVATQRAARNIQGIKMFKSGGVNVYDVLGAEVLLVSNDGLAALVSRLAV